MFLFFSGLEKLGAAPSSLTAPPAFWLIQIIQTVPVNLEWFWAQRSPKSKQPEQPAGRRMSQQPSTTAPTLSPQFCFDERVLRGFRFPIQTDSMEEHY